jgi:uncharacterized membrane protein
MEQQTPEPSTTTTTNDTSRDTSPHKNTGMAIIAYIVFFVPLLTDAKEDPFVKYHVRQGLVLFLLWLVVSMVSWIPPIIFISPILYLGVLALMVVGILHASQGKEEPLPIIGQYASHFHI